MAGTGPPPKDPRLRQRRNKVSTAATLSRETKDRKASGRRPGLPIRDCWRCARKRPNKRCKLCRGTAVLPWHPLTLAWWKDVWRSPMAPLFLEQDIHGLFVLAELVDQFWHAPSADAAKELRLQRGYFGLTPIDRRRLQWELEHPEDEMLPADPPPSPADAEEDRKVLLALVPRGA